VTHRCRAALLAAAVAAAGAGCADDASTARPEATPPATAAATSTAATTTTGAPGPAVAPPPTTIERTAAGLGATLQQWRDDEVAGRFQVRVDNATGSDLMVDSIVVEWAGFAAPTRSEPRYLVGDGTRVDLAVALPAARCSDPPSFDEALPPGPPVVVVNGTERVPITDVRHVLDRVHERSCTQQAIAHRATVAFGPDWELVEDGGDPVLRGDLVVAPRSTSSVALRGMNGSVLLSIEPEDGLAPAGDRVPVLVGRGGRCDPHALGDSKQTYVFDLALVVDGTEVDTSIVAEPWLQARMGEVIRARCGIS